MAGIMMFIYTDDCIIAIKDSSQIESIKGIAAKFEITDEGEVDEYLGVKVECSCNHS